MRTITSLIVSCLIIATGCVESPYDVALRHQRELQNEQEKMDRWHAILIADAMAELQPLIDQANENLSKLDGVVYVDVQEFDRVVFFEEVPDEKDVGESRLTNYLPAPQGDNPRKIAGTPKGTVRNAWTDRFALAQEFSCRYEVGEAEVKWLIEDDLVPFVVIVPLKLVGTRRSVVAGEAAIPQPPEGYAYWRSSTVFSGLYGSGRWAWLGFTGKPGLPPGQRHQPGSDPLADKAAEMLSAQEPTTVTLDRKASVLYRTESGWHVPDEAGIISQAADKLTWTQGISKELEPHVFEPE